jgi:hypothetical protein
MIPIFMEALSEFAGVTANLLRRVRAKTAKSNVRFLVSF